MVAPVSRHPRQRFTTRVPGRTRLVRLRSEANELESALLLNQTRLHDGHQLIEIALQRLQPHTSERLDTNLTDRLNRHLRHCVEECTKEFVTAQAAALKALWREIDDLSSSHGTGWNTPQKHPHRPGPSIRTLRRRAQRSSAKRFQADSLCTELVYNDTTFPLTRHHQDALNLGLSFVPTPKVIAPKWEDDSEHLRRNLNLRIHWTTHSSEGSKRSIMSSIAKSDWQPPDYITPQNPAWNSFKKDSLVTLNAPAPHSNMHPSTRSAWKALTTHPDFYVLKADKGGKTVMWYKDQYRKEALRQLSDVKTYQTLSKEEIDAAITTVIREKNGMIKRLKKEGHITEAESQRLLKEETRIPAIYFLPKIHKEKRPDTGTFAGRPIMASVGSPLKSLDVYIAKLTSPLLPLIPGSLQDTRSLLQDIAEIRDLPKGATLFSADVESLYPSIPWEEGIKAATRFYASRFHELLKDARTNNRLPPPKPKLFRDILTLVLTKNYLHFQNSSWYHQKSGTAMGCSISVFFANAFLFYRTEELLKNPPTDLKYLGRYIDDIIGVWTGKKEDIPGIFSGVTDESIKLTYVIGGDQLEALDLALHLTSTGTITTKIFRKPTDGHQYVHWKSAHPIHLKKSIPYAQLLRLKRNCSSPLDFEEAAVTLLDRFRTRGYPEKVLQTAKLRADLRSRRNLVGKKNRETDPPPKSSRAATDGGRLTIVTDYPGHSAARSLKQDIDDLWRHLHLDPVISERVAYYGNILPGRPPRVAFRSGRNLGSTLGPIYKKGDTKK